MQTTYLTKNSYLGYYKEPSKISREKTNLIRKWVNDMKRCFTEEAIQMARDHKKRCSSSLEIRGMHIETRMRYHCRLLEQVK